MSDLWKEGEGGCLCGKELLNLYKFFRVVVIMEEEVGLKIEKKSKDLTKLKEGDKFFINGKKMIVDKQFLFLEHKDTNEMIIEVYNPENEREYQVRYFDDQIDTSIEVYELVGDFEYVRREPKTVGW